MKIIKELFVFLTMAVSFNLEASIIDWRSFDGQTFQVERPERGLLSRFCWVRLRFNEHTKRLRLSVSDGKYKGRLCQKSDLLFDLWPRCRKVFGVEICEQSLTFDCPDYEGKFPCQKVGGDNTGLQAEFTHDFNLVLSSGGAFREYSPISKIDCLLDDEPCVGETVIWSYGKIKVFGSLSEKYSDKTTYVEHRLTEGFNAIVPNDDIVRSTTKCFNGVCPGDRIEFKHKGATYHDVLVKHMFENGYMGIDIPQANIRNVAYPARSDRIE